MATAIEEMCADVSPGGRRPRADEPLRDAGFDSLAMAELAVAVEERFGVRLAATDVLSLRTVQDIVRAVVVRSPSTPRVPGGIGRCQAPVKLLAGWAVRWYSHLKVVGAEHVPEEGPAIVAANHRSMLDIPVLVVACPRPVYFMGKQELFADPLRRAFFHATGGFPVRREIADIRAVEVALGLLERGDLVGLYPEGKRSRTGEMLPFLKGAAWLALRSGAPVVPCGLSGTTYLKGQGRFRKHVTVAFGPPIRVDLEAEPIGRRERIDDLTERILEAVASLIRH